MEPILLLFVILVLALLSFVKQDLRFRRKYSAFFKLPSPFYIPVLGNTYIFLGNDILHAFTKIVASCGNPCVVYLPQRTYITSVPEEVKIILNNQDCLDKNSLYKSLNVLWSKSLALTTVAQWKINRKMLSKGFKQNTLDSFVNTFYEKSCRLANVFKEKPVNDPHKIFEKLTLEAFSDTTLGIESTLMTDPDNYFVKCVTTAPKLMMSKVTGILKRNNFFYSFYSEKTVLDQIVYYMGQYIQSIIDIKEFKRMDYMTDPNRLPVMDILLESKEALGLDYIKEEMALFATAATDATAYALSYTCCLLAMNEGAQEKVRQEVLNEVGQDREITFEDLNRLKYTEMAINESLRLLPSLPFVGRRTTSDIDLGSKVIPAGTDIIINIINLHRDENVYPNPLRYDPDRFLPEEVQKRPQYSFIPFSGGPRNCIGWKYATMLIKTIVANIVRNFNISTKYKSIEEITFTSHVVISATHPLDMQFTQINDI